MTDASGLQFSFKDFRDEIQAITALAKPLLTRKAFATLERFEKTVGQLGHLPVDRPRDLEVSGVRTRPSAGEYEKGHRRGKVISAELSSKWEIKPVGSTGKKKPRPCFRLVGLASTCISIRDESDQILARWHVDVADQRSPGCHFHVQVAQEDDGLPFPAWLPVPRFPSLLVTPMAALDFVLGELFQDRWLKRTSESIPHAHRWRKIQRKRWLDLLGWHRERIEEARETCSPWISIKNARPPADLFSRKP
jgi:hypothetical protein